jgi:hypothetical protein
VWVSANDRAGVERLCCGIGSWRGQRPRLGVTLR